MIPPHCPCTLVSAQPDHTPTHAWSTLVAPTTMNVPVNPAMNHGGFLSRLGDTGEITVILGLKGLGGAGYHGAAIDGWVSSHSNLLNLLDQAMSPHGHLTLVHHLHFVFPIGLFVGTSSDTRTNWGVKAQPSAVKRGICWAVQQSQGSTSEPTSKDQLISWSSLE